MRYKQRIQILARHNHAGLSRDLALMSKMLTDQGALITQQPLSRRGVFSRNLTRLRNAFNACQSTNTLFDLNIMLERIRPEFLPQAPYNILIPNPEYFDETDKKHLRRIDCVWCKTHHAMELFSALGAQTHYIGFTSPDRYREQIARKVAFFHGPGKSNNKGTEDLIALWSTRPDWPQLTIAWRHKYISHKSLPANICIIDNHMNEEAYRCLQNRFWFHICPSQTEGFGHYILEAMSCGAIVLTLNAPPMNEHVTTERGILIAATQKSKQGLAPTWAPVQESYGAIIDHCLTLSLPQIQAIGGRAREYFLKTSTNLEQTLAKGLASFSHEES